MLAEQTKRLTHHPLLTQPFLSVAHPGMSVVDRREAAVGSSNAGLPSRSDPAPANAHDPPLPQDRFGAPSRVILRKHKDTPSFLGRVHCGVGCRRNCKHEDFARARQPVAIAGLHSHWVLDRIVAMQRPSERLIREHGVCEQFRRLGIRAVVNLQQAGEHPYCGDGILLESGFSYRPETFMEAGISYFNFPWHDMGVPSHAVLMSIVQVISGIVGTAPAMLSASAGAAEKVESGDRGRGGKIAIHCHAGLGRTGLVIACFLISSLKASAADAIDIVRSHRPRSIQTRKQVAFVHAFERSLQALRLTWLTRSFLHHPTNRGSNGGPSLRTQASLFSVEAYQQRQLSYLGGSELRKLRFAPKILHEIGSALHRLCAAQVDAAIDDGMERLFSAFLDGLQAFRESDAVALEDLKDAINSRDDWTLVHAVVDPVLLGRLTSDFFVQAVADDPPSRMAKNSTSTGTRALIDLTQVHRLSLHGVRESHPPDSEAVDHALGSVFTRPQRHCLRCVGRFFVCPSIVGQQQQPLQTQGRLLSPSMRGLLQRAASAFARLFLLCHLESSRLSQRAQPEEAASRAGLEPAPADVDGQMWEASLIARFRAHLARPLATAVAAVPASPSTRAAAVPPLPLPSPPRAESNSAGGAHMLEDGRQQQQQHDEDDQWAAMYCTARLSLHHRFTALDEVAEDVKGSSSRGSGSRGRRAVPVEEDHFGFVPHSVRVMGRSPSSAPRNQEQDHRRNRNKGGNAAPDSSRHLDPEDAAAGYQKAVDSLSSFLFLLFERLQCFPYHPPSQARPGDTSIASLSEDHSIDEDGPAGAVATELRRRSEDGEAVAAEAEGELNREDDAVASTAWREQQHKHHSLLQLPGQEDDYIGTDDSADEQGECECDASAGAPHPSLHAGEPCEVGAGAGAGATACRLTVTSSPDVGPPLGLEMAAAGQRRDTSFLQSPASVSPSSDDSFQVERELLSPSPTKTAPGSPVSDADSAASGMN